MSGYGVCLLTLDSLGLCAAYTSLPPSNEKTIHTHSPGRGLCELHMGWGLLEPLIHSHLGAIVTMVESLIKSHVFFIRRCVV